MFGGTFTILHGDLVLNGTEQILAVGQDDGGLRFQSYARRLAIGQETAFLLTGERIIAVPLEKWPALRVTRDKLRTSRWRQAGLEDNLAWAEKRRERLLEEGPTGTGEEHRTQLAANEGWLTQTRGQLAGVVTQEQAVVKAIVESLRTNAIWHLSSGLTDAIALSARILFAGGQDIVKGFDIASGDEAWSAPVNGRARGIAVADGRVIVGTDAGSIHCFSEAEPDAGGRALQAPGSRPVLDPGRAAFFARTAQDLVADSGARSGYALVIGGGTGGLALELARCSELMVYMVEPDARKVADARRSLSEAGLYGGRVMVMQGELDSLSYPDYFANLIVCEAGFSSGIVPTPAAEVFRMLKPHGGVAYVGVPPGMAKSGLAPDSARHKGMPWRKWVSELKAQLSRDGDEQTRLTVMGELAAVRRGALPGAGSWTHEYADPGNTGSSNDERVRAPFSLLWFGDPGPGRMPSRHSSSAAPLSVAGRMFVQGENVIMAYDAYNGTLLWQREIEGAMRLRIQSGRCSNLAATEDSLFVVVKGTCLRLDAATGKTVDAYTAPTKKPGERTDWGEYIAVTGNSLFGSSGRDRLFSIEIETGRTRWLHDGRDIMFNTVCIGDGMLFFVQLSLTEHQKADGLTGINAKARIDRRGKTIEPDVRLVTALDAETGAKKWERPQYVSDCVKISDGGGDLTVMYSRGVVLLCGQPWNGHFWQQFFAGEFDRRSLIALDAASGRELWSGHKGYRSRPIIVGDRVIAEPWAHNLRTGSPQMRRHPVTGMECKWQFSRPGHHCGNIMGSPNALFFRSGSIAYYDMVTDEGTAHFGGQRTGCWINLIPANGLVIMPEASSGCMCPFPLQCTTVLYPSRTSRAWGLYSAPGPVVPVGHLAVNLGAPGDRKDPNGKLWLGFPRPRQGRLVIEFPAEATFENGTKFYMDGERSVDTGSDDTPWIYACGSRGLKTLSIDLTGDEKYTGQYTVRLFFAEPDDGVGRGERVFDVAMQDKPVLTKLDIVGETGGAARALVKEFKAIRVSGSLRIGMTPRKGETLLCAVEVERETLPLKLAEMRTEAIEGRSATVQLPVSFMDGTLAAVGTVIVKQPAHGSLTQLSPACYRYTANMGYMGRDSFTWLNEKGEGQPARVTIDVKPDTIPPAAKSAQARVETGAVLVRFSKQIDPVTAVDLKNYTLEPSVGVEGIGVSDDGRIAVLTTTGLTPATVYRLNIRGLRDVAAKPNAMRETVLEFVPDGVPARICEKPPVIDAKLDDPCWQGLMSIPFENGQHTPDSETEVFLAKDDKALYVGFVRPALAQDGSLAPFVANKTSNDDAYCWEDDELEVFVADTNRQAAIQFGVAAGGGRFEGLNDVSKPQEWSNTGWDCEWEYATKRTRSEWIVELAIPMSTLEGAGIDTEHLALNVMSQSRSGGEPHIWLTDPGPLSFGRCQTFLTLGAKRAAPPAKK